MYIYYTNRIQLNLINCVLFEWNWNLDIDGLEGMRHTCGIIVAEEKGKVGKEGKVCIYLSILSIYIYFISIRVWRWMDDFLFLVELYATYIRLIILLFMECGRGE